jgi:hypothetical protein
MKLVKQRKHGILPILLLGMMLVLAVPSIGYMIINGDELSSLAMPSTESSVIKGSGLPPIDYTLYYINVQLHKSGEKTLVHSMDLNNHYECIMPSCMDDIPELAGEIEIQSNKLIWAAEKIKQVRMAYGVSLCSPITDATGSIEMVCDGELDTLLHDLALENTYVAVTTEPLTNSYDPLIPSNSVRLIRIGGTTTNIIIMSGEGV